MPEFPNNLEELHAIFTNPAAFSEDQASIAIAGFLYHVTSHLNAAGRLLLDEVPDAFKDLYLPKD